MKSILKRLIRLTSLAIMALMLLLWGPQRLGYQLYYVASGSMSPGIRTGDIVYVKACRLSEVMVGDVITYTQNQGKTTVTHRVLQKDMNAGLLQTKGDANERADSAWVSEEELLGKVCYHLPLLGKAAWLLSDWTGKLLVLGIILWLVALQNILKSILDFGKKNVR